MGFLRLCLALTALIFVVCVIAPIPIERFGPMRDYAQVLRDTGIAPGALYYTDVAQSNEAEMNNRDSLRFFAHRSVEPDVLLFLFSYFSVLLWALIRQRKRPGGKDG